MKEIHFDEITFIFDDKKFDKIIPAVINEGIMKYYIEDDMPLISPACSYALDIILDDNRIFNCFAIDSYDADIDYDIPEYQLFWDKYIAAPAYNWYQEFYDRYQDAWDSDEDGWIPYFANDIFNEIKRKYCKD